MLHIILPIGQLALILIAVIIANTAFFFVSIYRVALTAAKEHENDEIFNPDRIVYANAARVKRALKNWIAYCLTTSVAFFILFDLLIALITFTSSVLTVTTISGLILFAAHRSDQS